MKKLICLLAIFASFAFAKSSYIDGVDYGILSKMVGHWSTEAGKGMDVAPARKGTKTGAGNPAMSPFYETLTVKPAADSVNASKEKVVALSYVLQVYRTSDHKKFHDQRGYLIYDKKNKMVYNDFCIPRDVCVTAEAKESNKIAFKASAKSGTIAQIRFMQKNAKVTNFTMNIDLTKKDIISYSMITTINIYGKKHFSHADTSTLKRVK